MRVDTMAGCLILKALVSPISLHPLATSQLNVSRVLQSATTLQWHWASARAIGQLWSMGATVQNGMVGGVQYLRNRPHGIITTRAIKPAPNTYANRLRMPLDMEGVPPDIRLFLLRQSVMQLQATSDSPWGIGGRGIMADLVHNGMGVRASSLGITTTRA